MSKVKRLSRIGGDHPYSLTDDFAETGKRITQTRYFRAGDVVIGIAELNRPNHWNDPAFDAACDFLQAAWNAKAIEARRAGTTKIGPVADESAVSEGDLP